MAYKLNRFDLLHNKQWRYVSTIPTTRQIIVDSEHTATTWIFHRLCPRSFYHHHRRNSNRRTEWLSSNNDSRGPRMLYRCQMSEVYVCCLSVTYVSIDKLWNVFNVTAISIRLVCVGYSCQKPFRQTSSVCVFFAPNSDIAHMTDATGYELYFCRFRVRTNDRLRSRTVLSPASCSLYLESTRTAPHPRRQPPRREARVLKKCAHDFLPVLCIRECLESRLALAKHFAHTSHLYVCSTSPLPTFVVVLWFVKLVACVNRWQNESSQTTHRFGLSCL